MFSYTKKRVLSRYRPQITLSYKFYHSVFKNNSNIFPSEDYNHNLIFELSIECNY